MVFCADPDCGAGGDPSNNFLAVAVLVDPRRVELAPAGCMEGRKQLVARLVAREGMIPGGGFRFTESDRPEDDRRCHGSCHNRDHRAGCYISYASTSGSKGSSQSGLGLCGQALSAMGRLFPLSMRIDGWDR